MPTEQFCLFAKIIVLLFLLSSALLCSANPSLNAAQLQTSSTTSQEIKTASISKQQRTFTQLLRSATEKQKPQITTIAEAKKRTMINVSMRLLRRLRSKIKRQMADMQDKIYNLKSSLRSSCHLQNSKSRRMALTTRSAKVQSEVLTSRNKNRKLFDRHSRDFEMLATKSKKLSGQRGTNKSDKHYQKLLHRQRMQFEKAMERQKAINNELIAIILTNTSEEGM